MADVGATVRVKIACKIFDSCTVRFGWKPGLRTFTASLGAGSLPDWRGQWMGAEIFYHYDPDMNQCLCVAYRYPSQSHIGHCEKCGEVRPVRSAAAVDRPAREQWASGHGRQEPSLFVVLVPLLGARRLTTYR